MQISFPFQVNPRGRSAETSESEHIRQLIEQILFTLPGERVNRPDFGTGVQNFIFAPAEEEMLTAAKFILQGELQQQLSHLIQIENVQIESEDNVIQVTIHYLILKNQKPEIAHFKRALNQHVL